MRILLNHHFEQFIFIFVLHLILMSSTVNSQSLVINEFLASNKTINQDNLGNYSDWIEIYNAGDTLIHLAGYTLTDSRKDSAKWIFPAVSLAADDFLLIWASGDNVQDSLNLHTNFKLSADGEFLALYNPDGNVVDSLEFGIQNTDISWGRKPDGGEQWFSFETPTPGSSNNEVDNLLPTPEFSLAQGFYDGPVTIELTTSDPSLMIYYSTNGEIPTRRSYKYTNPIVLEKTRVIRAVCFNSDFVSSLPVTKTYLINEPVNLPVFSLVMEPEDLWHETKGIYVNYSQRGDRWERPAASAFFTQEDGLEFEINAGVRMHGYGSRKYDKKSFRLYFRSEYGQTKLNYRVFRSKKIKEFDRLIVRVGQDQITGPTNWTFVREPMIQSLFSRFQPEVSAKRSIALFLNGEYWGTYNFRERIDEGYIESNFNLTDFDLLKAQTNTHHPEIEAGDEENWLQTYDYFLSNDLSLSTRFAQACEMIDVDNFTDYNIIQIWGANWDWPHRNAFWYRPRIPEGKWRWILWDADAIFASEYWDKVDWNAMEWATRSEPRPDLMSADSEDLLWSTVLLRKMLENEDYKTYFINRFADLLNSTLNCDAVAQTIDSLAAIIEPDVPLDVARWERSSLEEWQQNVADMKEYAEQRQTICYQHLIQKFGLYNTLDLSIEPAEPNGGTVKVNSIEVTQFPWRGTYFKQLPVTLKATAKEGYRFVGWDGIDAPEVDSIVVVLQQDATIQPVFERIETPPVLTAFWAKNILSRSALIGWKADRPARSRIEYGIDQTYGNITTLDSQLVIEKETLVTGLMPDTQYLGRIHLIGENGDSTVSDFFTFSTLDSSYLDLKISAVLATKITPYSATITWQTERPATAKVLFGTDQNINQSTPQDTTHSESHSIVLTELKPNTRYFFRIESADKFENISVSDIYNFTTLDTTQLQIISVGVDSIAAEYVKIIWKTTKTADAAVEFGFSSDSLDFRQYDSRKVTDHVQELNGLAPNTIYYFQVISTDQNQLTVKSDVMVFTTLDTTSLRISNVHVENLAYNKAEIVWETNLLSNSEVVFGNSPDSLFFTQSNKAMVLNHQLALTGLTPNLTYFYKVRSSGETGYLAERGITQFTTPDTVQLEISYIRLDSLGSTGATIAWNTNLPANSEIIYGFAPDSLDQKILQEDKTEDHKLHLTSLLSDRIYHFQVRSIDENLNEQISDIFSFTTFDSLESENFDHTFQAELMPVRTAGEFDSPGWVIPEGSYLEQSITFPKTGMYQLTVRIKQNNESKPTLQLKIDNQKFEKLEIQNPEFEFFSLVLQIDYGLHKIQLICSDGVQDSTKLAKMNIDLLRVVFSKPIDNIALTNSDLQLPTEMRLEQNYPNPGNPGTSIKYSIPKASNVVLKIYNLFGQEVRELVANRQERGEYVVLWNGCDEQGVPVASGVYVYRLDACGTSQAKKVLILK